MQSFGRNRYGPKIGGLCPFWGGELGPHLTQCGQCRGLPACQVSSWSVQPFGHSARTLQTGQRTEQERQRTDSIGRTVLQTVAQKWNRPTYCAVMKAYWTLKWPDGIPWYLGGPRYTATFNTTIFFLYRYTAHPYCRALVWYCKYRRRYWYRYFKISDIGSIFRYTDPRLLQTDRHDRQDRTDRTMVR